MTVIYNLYKKNYNFTILILSGMKLTLNYRVTYVNRQVSRNLGRLLMCYSLERKADGILLLNCFSHQYFQPTTFQISNSII